ncbi:MAG: methylmalonyl-CoA mutase [Euryarchaeota archaeon]|nr:methylmalonyl-CoA mutase [Euryarchaeota archaeon]
MYEKKTVEEVCARRKKWEETTLKDTVCRAPERRKSFITCSSKPIERLYAPDDLGDFDYLKKLNFPGEYPYTRGVHPTMYRGQFWTMREFSGFGTAEDTNARFKYLLSHGETGLSTAFHLPTLYGYDSDHEFSRGEIGKCGVAIDSLKDMEILFSGIPLDNVTTSMTINAPAGILLAMYIAVAMQEKVSPKVISGTIQNDILKEYMAQKSYIYPPKPSMRIITDIMGYCAREVPRWNTISISGYHIREAGSTALQELAFTLADGIEYVKAGVEAGLDVDAFAPRLSFFFNAHNDLFEELAKYRAARRIWATVMRERFKARNPRSWWLRFHTQTAGCSLTAQQPENNIVRVTIQALAAVLGGTQSLHTNSMDEAWALPSEKAVRIALRTQQIIAQESGVTNTIDPVGGSFFIEQLTNEMEEGAYRYFDKIDKLGGVIPAIEKGFFQQEIANAAYRYQKEIESKDRIIVGVNDYKMEKDEVKIPLLKVEKRVETTQIRRLGSTRKNRDNKKVKALLAGLKAAAEGQDNLMPHFLHCAQAYATIGEICDVLRSVWGEYEEPPIF